MHKTLSKVNTRLVPHLDFRRDQHHPSAVVVLPLEKLPHVTHLGISPGTVSMLSWPHRQVPLYTTRLLLMVFAVKSTKEPQVHHVYIFVNIFVKKKKYSLQI